MQTNFKFQIEGERMPKKFFQRVLLSFAGVD